MDINLTLIGQMLTFVVFIWFTMKYVWPPLMTAMEERRKKIADGLAAAEQGERELEMAQARVKDQLLEAKTEAASILEQANQRAIHIIEEAKANAREEGARLLQLAEGEIDQAYHAAREALKEQVTGIVVAGAEKLLQNEVDQAKNDGLLTDLIGEI